MTHFYPPHLLVSKLELPNSGIDCSSLTGPLSHLYWGGQLLTWRCFDGESAGEQDWRGLNGLFQRYHSFLKEAIQAGEGLFPPPLIHNLFTTSTTKKKKVLHSWWKLQKGRKDFEIWLQFTRASGAGQGCRENEAENTLLLFKQPTRARTSSSKRNPALTIASGLPTTSSSLDLWLLSARESVSDLNGSRQRKGGCRGLCYSVTPTSQHSGTSPWEAVCEQSCPRWCLYHQAKSSH